MIKTLLASFSFFTKLPLWKITDLSKEHYQRVIYFWPIVGLFTGGMMALVLWGGSLILPYSVAVVLALAVRLLLTGALHEDGLADFFDGIFGGTTREKRLEIMKDSHIGSYGVISLILYYLLLFTALFSIPLEVAVFALVIGDVSSKWIVSNIVNLLPYARSEEQAKSKIVYQHNLWGYWGIALIFSAFVVVAPVVFFGLEAKYLFALLLPMIIFALLLILLKKRIGGYTGDCCGALFLLCELSFILGILII